MNQDEAPKNGPDQDESGNKDEVKTDKLKHQRLIEEKRRMAESKKKFKDFARGKMSQDTKGMKRLRREKNIGGTRGRRGG